MDKMATIWTGGGGERVDLLFLMACAAGLLLLLVTIRAKKKLKVQTHASFRQIVLYSSRGNST